MSPLPSQILGPGRTATGPVHVRALSTTGNALPSSGQPWCAHPVTSNAASCAEKCRAVQVGCGGEPWDKPSSCTPSVMYRGQQSAHTAPQVSCTRNAGPTSGALSSAVHRTSLPKRCASRPGPAPSRAPCSAMRGVARVGVTSARLCAPSPSSEGRAPILAHGDTQVLVQRSPMLSPLSWCGPAVVQHQPHACARSANHAALSDTPHCAGAAGIEARAPARAHSSDWEPRSHNNVGRTWVTTATRPRPVAAGGGAAQGCATERPTQAPRKCRGTCGSKAQGGAWAGERQCTPQGHPEGPALARNAYQSTAVRVLCD